MSCIGLDTYSGSVTSLHSDRQCMLSMALLFGLIPLVVIFPAALVVLPWDKSIITEPFVWDAAPTPSTADVNTPEFSRRTVHFPSQGLQLEGWLYTPKGMQQRPPIVVAAHGIAGQKDMGLEPFAELFATKGMAVLLFDYRNFGGSEGEPRNWVSPKRHLQDWDAALDYVRSSLAAEVDITRIGLWGTSFAGGHVLVTAAKEGTNVTAVVSQVPHLSGFEASKQSIKNRGLLQSIRLFLAGLHDRARALANMPAAYLKVAGTPGSNSFMELSEEDLQQYFNKHPSKYAGGWQNRILARLSNEMSRYNPIQYVAQVKAPVLMVATTRDALCSIHLARRAASLNPLVKLVEKDAGHFDVYLGSTFEEVAGEQAKFFVETFEHPVPVVEATEAMPLL
ncbi:g12965 [Coccomyxa viridis]|uniref:G12965 protein n=1 Tax=Coccomyxa viridis TaxID=1274662 RepID=A0ABP1GE97_9CHLO